ncbi:MAG: DUF2178 domain-containing protein [Haloarculaceae archaeon]
MSTNSTSSDPDAGSNAERFARRRTYRRLMVAVLAAGVAAALLLREWLGRPLLGEAAYWLGVLAFLAVWLGTDVTLFDERDRALERRASQVTLVLCAAVLVVGASAARVLSVTDAADVPPAAWHVLWGYAALFVVFGAVYLWLRYR